jgi:hypothetical protein
VSADDGGASGSGIGPTGLRRENGAAVFATTHWSVVLEAQGESPAAQDALEELCRTYWRPVYAFLRRQGVGPEEAEDITQGFFAHEQGESNGHSPLPHRLSDQTSSHCEPFA